MDGIWDMDYGLWDWTRFIHHPSSITSGNTEFHRAVPHPSSRKISYPVTWYPIGSFRHVSGYLDIKKAVFYGKLNINFLGLIFFIVRVIQLNYLVHFAHLLGILRLLFLSPAFCLCFAL